MTEIPDGDKKRIFVVLIVLAVLIAGILLVRRQKALELSKNLKDQGKKVEITIKPEEKVGKMSISVSPEKLLIGENGFLTVNFLAPEYKLYGADVILLYDPQFIEVRQDSLSFGDYFNSFPRQQVDQENGIIKVTAISGRQENMKNEDKLFSFEFTALKAGQTKVDFDFKLGETNTTTLVEKETSKNILETVEGITINIEE